MREPPQELRYGAVAVTAWDEGDDEAVVRVGEHRLRLTPAATERLMRHLRRLPWNRDAIL